MYIPVINSIDLTLKERILIIVLAGTILLILVIFLLLEKFVFKVKRYKKMYQDIVSSYEYYHALLTGQDAQYIQRIEIISRTNLLYVDIQNKYFKEFKELRDETDYKYSQLVAQFEDFLHSRNFKEFKKLYKNSHDSILEYQKSIDNFNLSLVSLIKPEEEARQAATVLKEKLRDVKSKFNQKEKSLLLVKDSFNKIFDEIGSRFNKFETLLESAEYNEAKSLLPDVEKVLNYLERIIELLPDIITTITENVPQEIHTIEDKFNSMLNEGYALFSLHIDVKLRFLKDKNKSICDNVAALSNIDSVNIKVSEIRDMLKEIDDSLNEEIKAKKQYDEKYEIVSSRFSELEKKFIRLSNMLNNVRKYYLIDQDHENEFIELKDSMDKVAKEKRDLDIFVKNIANTPYIVLIDRTIILENGTDNAEKRFNNFSQYVANIRKEVEDAYSNIRKIYNDLKSYEAKYFELKNDPILSGLNNDFDRSFELIDAIDSLTKVSPLNVKNIVLANNELSCITNKIFALIDQEEYEKEECERNLIIFNTERLKFNDIKDNIQQAEQIYKNENFKECLILINKINIKLKEKIASGE